MQLFGVLLELILLLLTFTSANVEKVIFTARSSEENHKFDSCLSGLPSLDSYHPILRTALSASFPSSNGTIHRGSQHWFVLAKLEPGQRYEARVCWAAIQPTEFQLDTFDLDQIGASTELNSSLHESVQHTQYHPPYSTSTGENEADNYKVLHRLLLRVIAKADYYTPDKSLMQNVPPVNVDIILDPYIFNAIPRSLLPTGAYIVVLAILAWVASYYISTGLNVISIEGLSEAAKEAKSPSSKKQN